jgi:hypothetical protein
VLYNENNYILSLPICRWKTHDNSSGRQGMRKVKGREDRDGVLLSRSESLSLNYRTIAVLSTLAIHPWPRF